MEAGKSYDNLATAQSLSTRLLNLPAPPRHETAGGRCTRMIIDSASYTTTPCNSPPPELSHDFSAYDDDHKVPDVAALTETGRVLEFQLEQNELGNHIAASRAKVDPIGFQQSGKKEHVPSDLTWRPHGIIPTYMLQAIATSEVAGPQARARVEQTTLSQKPAESGRQSKENLLLTALAQRQSEDGRWVTVI